ncbi:hypothetical protein [Actinoplanes sp. NPDC051851]|uniref:hypothetical protein n=1 Tax=Actinoplanes sp. NPDC051851 TaxID=3154753 RepID=UPI00342CD444
MKRARLIRAAAVLVSALIGAGTVAVTTSAGPASAATLPACTAKNFQATSFKLDGGFAEIQTTMKTACKPQEVTLVTYLAPQPKFAVPQYLFASQTETLSLDNKSQTFKVALPDCNTQADLFIGGQKDIIETLVEGGARYNDKKIAYFNGGTSDCVQPAVQYSASCDGTVTLNLANNGQLSGVAVDFTVKYGEKTQVVSVPKGESRDLIVPADSGAITVSAKKLETTTINWALPENCAPSAAATNDCTSTTITVNNPESNGTVSAEVTYNGETKTVSIASGASESVSFKAAEAATASVKFPGSRLAELTVDVVLGECSNPEPSTSVSVTPSASASASPSASASASTSTSASTSESPTPVTTSTDSDDDGGELALTGAAASSIAGGAALLLIVGAGLFFMARRRKVNFKA